MDPRPDVKAIISLNHVRKTPAVSGYRPAHRIKEDYLTSGTHQYIGVDKLYPGQSCAGTISFLSPEAYPHCLSVGQILHIQEGERIVGTAEIIQIYTKLLERED